MSSTSTAAVGFRSNRGPVLVSVMLSTGLVAIDSTVLATAVPSIVGELGGFHQFPWLFSAYLLGQAVTTPIYAKLSDVSAANRSCFWESRCSWWARFCALQRGTCWP